MISATAFIEKFRVEWEHTTSLRHNTSVLLRISDREQNRKERSKFMLDKEGFIHRVMSRFLYKYPDLIYQTEIYTFDALYMGGGITYKSRDYNYPTHIYAIIEHENDLNVEEELWKLLIVRLRLKILIFYDYDEHRKTTTRRRDFIVNKISTLQGMINRAHTYLPEAQNVEYLCLVGNRKQANAFLSWKWTKTDAQFQFMPLIDL